MPARSHRTDSGRTDRRAGRVRRWWRASAAHSVVNQGLAVWADRVGAPCPVTPAAAYWPLILHPKLSSPHTATPRRPPAITKRGLVEMPVEQREEGSNISILSNRNALAQVIRYLIPSRSKQRRHNSFFA